jgi:hypothetical protein
LDKKDGEFMDFMGKAQRRHKPFLHINYRACTK